MKNLLRIEEAAQMAIAIACLYYQPVSVAGWLWPFLFLSPDIGMLGYVLGPAVGAATYNLTHHKGIAVALIGLGWFMQLPVLLLIGLLMYAHSAFDRMLGYGLKYPDAFRHTHLGWLPEGKSSRKSSKTMQ